VATPTLLARVDHSRELTAPSRALQNGFVVETLGCAGRDFAFGWEPIQDELLMSSEHPGDFLHGDYAPGKEKVTIAVERISKQFESQPFTVIGRTSSVTASFETAAFCRTVSPPFRDLVSGADRALSAGLKPKDVIASNLPWSRPSVDQQSR
jgi:hypothetical protein